MQVKIQSLTGLIHGGNSWAPMHSQQDLDYALSLISSILPEIIDSPALGNPFRLDLTAHFPVPTPLVSVALWNAPHKAVKESEVFDGNGNILFHTAKPPAKQSPEDDEAPRRKPAPSLTAYDPVYLKSGYTERSAVTRLEYRLQGRPLHKFIANGGWPSLARCYDAYRDHLQGYKDCLIDLPGMIPERLEGFANLPQPVPQYRPLDGLMHGAVIFKAMDRSPKKEIPVTGPSEPDTGINKTRGWRQTLLGPSVPTDASSYTKRDQ